MKILHVVPSFGFGGMERVLCTLINSTSESYSHVLIPLVQDIRATEWVTSGRMELVPFDKPEGRPQFFHSLGRHLQKIHPTLLMTYNWGATDAIWLGRLSGIKAIIHNEHGFNIEEVEKTIWYRDLIRLFVYRLASRIIVVSRSLQAMMQNTYHLSDPKVVRIPNGITIPDYASNSAERQKARQSLGFGDDDFVIGFIGRFDPVKNFDLMVEVVSRCVSRNLRTRLILVGDGPERDRILALCQAKAIQDRVVFLGQQRDVLPYLSAMDVFLLTSFREQMPLTVLEAMMLEVPVVAARVGEIPLVIDNNVDGYVCNEQNESENFFHAILQLMDPSRRKKMGEAARKKVIEQFREQEMVLKYKNIIDEVCLK